MRACRILSSFRSEHETLRLRDLASRAELPPSSTLRLVRTLEKCGFLTQVTPGCYRGLVSRPPGRRYRIGFVVDSAGRPFRQEVSLGLQYAAAQNGVELVCLDHSPDRRLAIRDADSLVRMDVSLVIDFQTGYDLAGAVAEKYLRAGIPMIAVDTPHPGATFVGVNNYVAGMDGGKWLGMWLRRCWRGKVDLCCLFSNWSERLAEE